MTAKYSFLLCLMALCVGCGGNKAGGSKAEISKVGKDTVPSEITDSCSKDSVDIDIDWTPEEFKKEHYDEWVVVKQAIDIQQQRGDIDFSKIDSLVKEYIHTKKIAMPANRYLRIKKIEQLCTDSFDISGYDESNMGEHIADGTARLFLTYVNWLFASEARKANRTNINLRKEESMADSVLSAFNDCCDSVGGRFQGSGGWTGWSLIHWMGLDFEKSMYTAILKPQKHKSKPILLTPMHFKDECKALMMSYKGNWEGAPSHKEAQDLLNRYCTAMQEWLQYRSRVERRISNPVLKADYSYITRSFARKQYIHLKNRFHDIGLASQTIEEACLKEDCSDKEMLRYSFEEALSKY